MGLLKRFALGSEQGITLILAVSVLTVLAVTGTTVVLFANANARSAARSNSDSIAYTLAEAGIDEAAAILGKEGNNAFDPGILPGPASPRTSTYGDGTVTWSGTFNATASAWTITSSSRVTNPIGPGTSALARTVSAKIKVSPPVPAPPQTKAWDFLYAGRTGNDCDMTLAQSGGISAPLYVAGNLCLDNTATLDRGPVYIGGIANLMRSSNKIGASGAPVSEAHIGGGCTYRGNPLHSPCGPADNVWGTVVDASPELIPMPTVYWDETFANASPGPFYPCKTQAGTPPVFDTAERIRNESVPGVFNLTPSTSYTCKTDGGELSWDASAKALTAKGTIFIDGSITADSSGASVYSGQATIYASGTFYMKNSTLCAVRSASKCDWTGWDPNQKLLIIATGGSGGQAGVDTGIRFQGSSFQGALYGTSAVQLDTTSRVQGPTLASTISIGQVGDLSFPKIGFVPPAAPGNVPAWSSISAPYDYSG